MNTHSHTGPDQASFLEIKQRLDPMGSYIIFENDLKQGGPSILDTAHGAYAFLERENFTWQQVLDPDLAREYLVVRIPKGDEDQALGRVMAYGLPKNTIYYLFKAREASS